MKPRTLGSHAQPASVAALLLLIGSTSWGQSDVILSETLLPGSNEVIDCNGGAILPAVPATESGGVAVPSSPDTLIFLKNVSGVRIQNCTLKDATFGVFVVGGGSHSIANNSIEAAAVAIAITKSDFNSIAYNTLSGTSNSINITNGSSDNLVLGNELTFRPGADQPRFPGFPGLAGFQYQMATGSENIGGVVNIIVNGELTQVPATVDNFTKDTLVLQNTIHNEGGNAGIGFLVRSKGSRALSNQVSGGFSGLLAAGYPDGEPGPFILPGKCSLDSSRYCASDEDCNLSGFDVESQGICDGAVQLFSESRRTIESEFANNTVTGAEEGIIAAYTDGIRIEGNNVHDGIFGIDLIGSYALEKGKVYGNIVSGNVYGFAIFNFLAKHAGVEVSYNDFGDNQFPFDAVQAELFPAPPGGTVRPYTLKTSLPGNWWGLECSEGGFPYSPRWPNTEDPSPFAEPVAATFRVNMNETDSLARCW